MDDDVELLEELGELVCLWGYHTITFSTPSAVLAYLGDKHADVLICDVDLPEMSGGQLADLIASRRPSVTIALMSGGAYPDDFGACRWPFFSKPIELNALKRFVQTAIRGTT
ncbi:MAG: response regulator [Devosia sp.]|nr:response regulator [Devosia sp.]